MRSTPFTDIMARLDALAVDDEARRAFRRLVLEVGAQHGISGLERDEQLAYIRRLLSLRVSRPTIRDRLMALYSVSRRQAYRLIDEAMQLCQKRP